MEELIADLIGSHYWRGGIGKSDEWCRALAREIIEAIREPTAEMIKAGEGALAVGHPIYECYAEKIWEAMIDAAFVEVAK